MITLANLNTEYPKIAQNTLPEVLRNKEYNFIQENLDLYSEDDTIKELIDVFIQKLNACLEKNTGKGTPKTTKSSKTKPSKELVFTPVPDIPKYEGEKPKKTATKTKKEKKSKAEKPASTAEQVAKIIPEIAFIKRYVLLHGKTKTKEQIVAFIKALQKAIVEKTIRKTSEYANIIEDIQDELLKCYKLMGNKIALTIAPDKYLQYRTIVEGVAVHPAVKLIKRFISLFGVQDEKVKAQKAERLLSAMKKEIEVLEKDPVYGKALADIYETLEHYLDKESDLFISEQKLNGLMGLAGVSDGLGLIPELLVGTASNVLANFLDRNWQKSKPDANVLNGIDGTILCSTDIVKMEFQSLDFQGKFKELIGNPSINFSTMVYGRPGGGKTTFCILFAKYLTHELGKKVLYATVEEGINHTFRSKLTRLQAYHPSLIVSDHIPKSMSKIDVLFIDSVNAFNLTPVDLKNLRKQYPNMIIIEILQCTKDGKFKGSQEYEHDVDVVICVENGIASTIGHKNRFGKSGEMQVW